MQRLSPITRSSLSDQVKERLLEEILSGRYPPGSRVIETRVARELGVSQGPVREALRDLGGLGIVSITAFEGARVRRGTKRELLEAYEIRAELESLGIRRAQARMSDTAYEELQTLILSMKEAAARGDVHTEARLDGAFHGRIMELSGNETLKRVWEYLEPVSRTYITLATAVFTPQLVEELHLPILKALRQAEPGPAEDAIRHHFITVWSIFEADFVDSSEASSESDRPIPTAPSASSEEARFAEVVPNGI